VLLQLSLEQAQAIAMTLPSLLTHARQDLTDKGARIMSWRSIAGLSRNRTTAAVCS
jgi:hypothetical protein